MELNDNKLKWFFDKELLQKTVDTCVDKGINLAEVRWFTQPENRVELAKQMAAGQYHIAPPHIIQIPKRYHMVASLLRPYFTTVSKKQQ